MRVKRLLKAGVISALACMVKADNAILTDQTKELLARCGCSVPGLGSKGPGGRRLDVGMNEGMSQWGQGEEPEGDPYGWPAIPGASLPWEGRGHCPFGLAGSQVRSSREEGHSFWQPDVRGGADRLTITIQCRGCCDRGHTEGWLGCKPCPLTGQTEG